MLPRQQIRNLLNAHVLLVASSKHLGLVKIGRNVKEFASRVANFCCSRFSQAHYLVWCVRVNGYC